MCIIRIRGTKYINIKKKAVARQLTGLESKLNLGFVEGVTNLTLQLVVRI